MTQFSSRLQTWLCSYPRESYIFFAASLMNAVGNALLWPLTTIYVHNVLHRSYGEAGLVLLFQASAGIIGQLLGGGLYHKLGAKRLIVSSLFLTGLAQLSLIVAKAWVPYILVMILNGFLNSVTMPAVNAFIGFRWPSQRVRLYNAVYVFNNIGVAIGTTLAGLLAVLSFDLTFLFDAISTIGFGAFFLLFLRRNGDAEAVDLPIGKRPQSAEASIGVLLADYRMYLFLAIGTILAAVSTSAWNSGVAPYLNQQGQSPATYSFLWTVNGLIILVGQPLTSLLNRYVTKSLYWRLITSAMLYLIGFFYMALLHASYFNLIIGMIICTFGEMQMNPTQPALVSQTTGRNAPFYLGLIGSCSSVGRLAGPPVYGNLFDRFGVSPILVSSTVAMLITSFMYFLHFVIRKRANDAGTSARTLGA